jgi:hypothetical protein
MKGTVRCNYVKFKNSKLILSVSWKMCFSI